MQKDKKRKAAGFKPGMGTGDQGYTSLAEGKRVRKTHPRIGMLAELDSLNSLVGLCKVLLKTSGKAEGKTRISGILDKVQDQLICVGGETAGYSCGGELDKAIKSLEKEIAFFKGNTALPGKFIKPGGNTVESLVHLSRSACRKLELKMWKPPRLKACAVYLNRLSDLLYLIALKIAKM